MSSSYSVQFKQDAVKLAVESDQSVAKTARDLSVNANTLYTWITKYHQPEAPTNKGSGEKHPHDELKRLRRENAQHKEGACKIFCVNGHSRLQTVTTGGTDDHT